MAVLPLALHLIFCGATVLVLARALSRLRGTTLVAPILWSMGAVSSIAIAEVVLFFPPMPGVTSWQSLVRYLAGTLTLLPVISVLGAKRPQALVWNYIVASLWLVLIMPALEVLLLKPQQTFEIYAFGPWMIAGLIFYTAIHYAGTGMGMMGVGLILAIAQTFYLAPHLPIQLVLPERWCLATSLLIFVAALSGFNCAPRQNDDPIALLWSQFKSGYGTAWALRLIQRLDELQVRHDWCVRLGWFGVMTIRDGATREQIAKDRKALARAFRSLLLRFLSPRHLIRFSTAELRQKPAAPVSTTVQP
jgi:hypothetical protein